jgi:MFS family permease
MRRLMLVASTLILFDVAFFSAIAPLLPDYVDDLGLSEADAGVLTAAYAAGTLLASLPAGLLATRTGPRRTVIYGLALLGVSSVVFGFGQSILVLDVARFSQGVAGALIWSGALSWLIVATPAERRGSVIGSALGTAVAGALIGPVLGAVAVEVGTEVVFSAVLVISAAFALIVWRMADPEVEEDQTLGEIWQSIRTRPVLTSTAFVAVPSLMFGAVELLVPLRIDELGAGHGVIAAGFVGGAALEAVLAPIAGRWSDRVGRRPPYVIGLAIGAAAMLGMAAAQTVGLVVAMLILVSLGAGISFAPVLTLLTESAEAGDLHQGFAAALSNMAWATGQVLGGVVGGVVADVAGLAVPCVLVAATLLATAVYALRREMPHGAPARPRRPADPAAAG